MPYCIHMERVCISNPNPKVAVLYFGQLRLRNGFTMNFDSLKKAISSAGAFGESGSPFNVYAHCWYSPKCHQYDVSMWSKDCETGKVDHGIVDFVLNHYRPEKILIEEPKIFDRKSLHPETPLHGPCFNQYWGDKEVSNMISQMYSIQQVCRLVEDKYDIYVLSRFDVCVESIPDLKTLNRDAVAQSTDHIQIFFKEGRTLSIYRNLLEHVKTRVHPYLNAEILRSLPLADNGVPVTDCIRANIVRHTVMGPIFLDQLSKLYTPIIYVNSSGFAVRKIADDHFSLIKHNRSPTTHHWIGDHLPLGRQTVRFDIKFLDRIPDPTKIGLKTHNPDVLHNGWMERVKETDTWYPIEMELEIEHPLVLYVTLDEVQEHVDLEIRIIRRALPSF